jgi:arsenite methyltransferase
VLWGKRWQLLRPGGRLLVADILHSKKYQRERERLGLEELNVRELGPGTWFGNPFMRTPLVCGSKPVRR